MDPSTVCNLDSTVLIHSRTQSPTLSEGMLNRNIGNVYSATGHFPVSQHAVIALIKVIALALGWLEIKGVCSCLEHQSCLVEIQS